MKPILLLATTGLMAVSILAPAQAWMHGNAGGGFTRGGSYGGWQHSTTVGPSGVSHSSDLGGFEHGTAANSKGVAHASNAGGYEHGSACGAGGCEHASNAGGYYHGTSASNGTVSHTGYYGTSTASYGNYYHQPAVVNSYGGPGGCYNCGGGGWGAAAAGVAVGTAVGVAVGAANTSAAYSAGVNAGYAAAAPQPVAYARLPAGCFYRPLAREYSCGSMWLAPAYGENGVFYQVVPPP